MATSLSCPELVLDVPDAISAVGSFTHNMHLIYDRMDYDLEKMGAPFVPPPKSDPNGDISADSLNGLVNVYLNGPALSFNAMGNVLYDRDRSEVFKRLALSAGQSIVKEATGDMTPLDWVEGLATTAIAVHANYMARLTSRFVPEKDMTSRQALQLEDLKAGTRCPPELLDAHGQHFIASDGDIKDWAGKRGRIAETTRNGTATVEFANRPVLWTSQLLEVVNDVRNRVIRIVGPGDSKEPLDKVTLEYIVGRNLPAFKDLESDQARATVVRTLMADLTKGTGIETTIQGHKTNVVMPTVQKPVAKEVVRLASAYAGNIDELVDRVNQAQLEYPDRQFSDEPQTAALLFLGSNIEILRTIGVGGRTSARKPWADLFNPSGKSTNS